MSLKQIEIDLSAYDAKLLEHNGEEYVAVVSPRGGEFQVTQNAPDEFFIMYFEWDRTGGVSVEAELATVYRSALVASTVKAYFEWDLAEMERLEAAWAAIEEGDQS